MYGLKDKFLTEIETYFKRVPNIETAILFGSRAINKHKNASDIDIALLGRNLKFEDKVRIITMVEDSFIPYTFDFLLLNDIHNLELIEHINVVGKKIYQKTSDKPL